EAMNRSLGLPVLGRRVCRWLQHSDVCVSSAFLVITCVASAPAAPSRDRAEWTGSATEAGGPVAGDGIAKALGDTVWIADWSFDAGAGTCTDAGWTKYDNHIQNDGSNFWQVGDDYSAMPDIMNRAAFLRRHDLCWAADGYGNNWDYSMILQASPGATLSFTRVMDSEPGFDFVTVEADSLGLSEARQNLCVSPTRGAASFRTVLLTSNGASSGTVAGLTMPASFGAGTHEFYIHFTSDAEYSDQDGEFLTANHTPLIIDNVVVTGTIAYSE